MRTDIRELWFRSKPLAFALICFAVAVLCARYLLVLLGPLWEFGGALPPGQLLDIESISSGITVAILGIGSIIALRWALGFGLVAVAQALTTGSRAHRRVASAALRLAPRFARTTLITAASAGLAFAGVPAIAADSGLEGGHLNAQEQPAYLGFAPTAKAPVEEPQTQAESEPPSTAVPEAVIDSPAPAPATATATATAKVSQVTVQHGDSLWSLTQQIVPDASASEIASLWPALFQANMDAIGSDPNLILPGTSLEIPTSFSSSPVR